MARRSPIAHGLEKQLELLAARGYRVVTVSQLLELSPFQDVLPGTPTPGRRSQPASRGP